ncbi:hypothetical protein ABTX77_33585 [Streptomyces sp. NPDC097704]|uniref:hypothetical protein n=1 Tax=Streptomyces sp. NPDC097704 TaxID=3157101 RepID=UPI0033329A8A
MTDLLRRLASRATGRHHRPATVPLLPPRGAAERLPREPVARGEDTAVQEVREVGAASHDNEASARGPLTADDRPGAVSAPPVPLPVVLPAPGTPPPPDPGTYAVRREAVPGVERRVEAGGTVPHVRPAATPVPVTPATIPTPVVPPAARASAADGGAGGPEPHDEPQQEPVPRRPRLRPVAPVDDSARPARHAEALGIPVVRPVPVPVPVPPAVTPRTAAHPAVAAVTDPAPAVTITIGRVEIRAVPPATHTTARPEADSALPGGSGAATLSLGDFLRGTGEAR